MSQLDTRNAEALFESQVERARHEAETRSLLRRAGMAQRSWLAGASYWLLGRLGNLLVAWGERLKQYDMPQALPLDGRASSCQ
jgi:hypothetical protein